MTYQRGGPQQDIDDVEFGVAPVAGQKEGDVVLYKDVVCASFN